MDIQEFKEQLRSEGISGLALDIDETLAASNDHWWNYMYEHHPISDMSREEIVANYRFAEEVPGWQTGEALARIKEALNSIEFHENIPLLEGADRAVQEVSKLVPIRAYITARPVTVRDVTKRWLKRHGFPEAELIMYGGEIDLNGLNQTKNRWKAEVVNHLYPEILGIVDDNPMLATQLEAMNYKGKVFLYGPEHKELASEGCVLVCPSWSDVHEAIKALNDKV